LVPVSEPDEDALLVFVGDHRSERVEEASELGGADRMESAGERVWGPGG
jgi:hypothetical protein